MMNTLKVCLLVVVLLHVCNAFVSTNKNSLVGRASVKPLQESFFIDLPTINDPAKATPKLLLGEDVYRDFVASYDDKSLINKTGKPFALGGEAGDYDPVERIAALKLLTLTVESGLLEALEARGLSLSQVEKLLPLVDNLGLLPLLAKNKGALVSLAPLLIEPAPSLLPVIVNVLKTSPVTFTALGGIIAAGGAYETFEGSGLGIPIILLGAPLIALGTVLGSLGGSLPSASSYSSYAAPTGVSVPDVSGLSKPSKSSARVSSNRQGGQRNGQRKVIRIKN